MRIWKATSLIIVGAAALAGVPAYGAEAADVGMTKDVAAVSASDAQPGDTKAPAAPAPVDDAAVKPLRITLGVYTWISNVTTDVDTGDSEVTSEVTFSDILDAVDFANFGHLEIQRGHWGMFSELDFIKLSNDTEFRIPRSGWPFKINADGVMKQTMIELGGMRSFEGQRVGFDALLGARYFRLESEVNVGPFESSVSKDWVDPMVGGRLRFRLSDRWNASLRGDLAGFGVGSELTTNIVGTLTYAITDRHHLGIGYRYLDIDYENDPIKMSVTTYGPVIGMIIRF